MTLDRDKCALEIPKMVLIMGLETETSWLFLLRDTHNKSCSLVLIGYLLVYICFEEICTGLINI